MRCIKQQLQAMLIGNCLQRFDWCGPTPQVHSDNAGSAWSDHATHCLRVEVMRNWIDIGEDGGNTLPS